MTPADAVMLLLPNNHYSLCAAPNLLVKMIRRRCSMQRRALFSICTALFAVSPLNGPRVVPRPDSWDGSLQVPDFKHAIGANRERDRDVRLAVSRFCRDESRGDAHCVSCLVPRYCTKQRGVTRKPSTPGNPALTHASTTRHKWAPYR